MPDSLESDLNGIKVSRKRHLFHLYRNIVNAKLRIVTETCNNDKNTE
jgi:hypothetical protein